MSAFSSVVQPCQILDIIFPPPIFGLIMPKDQAHMQQRDSAITDKFGQYKKGSRLG